MAARSDKAKKSIDNVVSQNNAGIKKPSLKSKKLIHEEEEDVEIEDVRILTSGKKAGSVKAKSEDEEDEVDEIEEDDNWKKEDDDEDWDPDFAEFDLPKSSSKKGVTIKKGIKEDDDDFKIDDEFKDLFSHRSSKYDDDDDY